MNRLRSFLKIQAGEERTSALLVGLMLFTAAGSSIGGNAIEALFFARFGVKLLPVMYIILGLFSFTASLAVTAVMGRIPKQRLYGILPVVIVIVLVGGRLVIPLNLRWFFAVMWLLMNVMRILQSLLTWGLAGAACDTRQAKRLFPLFSAGGILGAVVGGLATRPLAAWLHSENLLLIWAGAMIVSLVIGRVLVNRLRTDADRSGEPKAGMIYEMQRGFQFVRRSSILRWISYSSIFFSVCYFSLALPFSRGAAAQFTDPDRLAGFLGLFDSLNTVAALLSSLFLANRLFARFGIMPMLFVFPVIYLAGFTILALTATLFLSVPFLLLVATRFAQMAYMNGIADSSWQTIFNVVPAEQRDQVRTFVNGVPSQAGTFLAGLILFVGEQALRPQQLYWVGFGAAALLVYIIWKAGRAYGQALVDALRAGQPHVFYTEEQPFGGSRTDAEAAAVAMRGLGDRDTGTRRVSAEIIGHFQGPEVIRALASALRDEDALVRTTALRGLAKTRAAPALLDIATCLNDPEPEVRFQAISTLGDLAGSPLGIAAYVERSLADPDPQVRIQAALTLLRGSKQESLAPHSRARETLVALASDSDPHVCARAVEALGVVGEETGFAIAAAILDDSRPVVRIAAAKALAGINPSSALEILIRHLNDPDLSVRQALAEALAQDGERALQPLIAVLTDPSREEGALLALGNIPAGEAMADIRGYARSTAQAALRYHTLASAAARDQALNAAQPDEGVAGYDGTTPLLIKSLQDEAGRRGLNALRAVGLLTGRDSVYVAVENLRSQSAVQRANALETLEAVGDREIIRPLLVLWEGGDTSRQSLPGHWLADLLDDPSAWLRACAVLVAARSAEAAVPAKLESMSCNDPDEMVRAAAKKAMRGEAEMETLTTLSLMERILFLQRVPLFAELPPVDLKQIAAVTGEVLFSDGQVIARQGAPGMEMYIVVSGEVRVLIANEGQTEPREVAVRRAGDYVGETALLIQEPRMATLIANGAVRALCLKQKTLESILRERPEIGLAMLRSLSQRLREASNLAAFH